MPLAMLNVSGIISMVKKAGMDSLKSSHFILTMVAIIIQPTIINAGAVMG
jgi:hypothetical protein